MIHDLIAGVGLGLFLAWSFGALERRHLRRQARRELLK